MQASVACGAGREQLNGVGKVAVGFAKGVKVLCSAHGMQGKFGHEGGKHHAGGGRAVEAAGGVHEVVEGSEGNHESCARG